MADDQQPHSVSTAGSAIVSAEAAKLLSNGKAAECTRLLQQCTADGIDLPNLRQWLIICEIVQHAQQGEWLKVSMQVFALTLV